jgi:hypothetical protein
MDTSRCRHGGLYDLSARGAKNGGHGRLSVAKARTEENRFQYTRLFGPNNCRAARLGCVLLKRNGATATEQ